MGGKMCPDANLCTFRHDERPFPMQQVIAVIGPPAVGKTTLTTRLGENPGCSVFRLREHVAPEILAAASVNPDRVDWIDDVNVARAVRAYIEPATTTETVHTGLLDNFPGSGSQVRLLLGILARLSPGCAVQAVELVLDEQARQDRVRSRRVCHTCEDDPARDPRLPAVPSESDPRKCRRCGSTLHPRRGDAPRLLAARTAHFNHEAPGLRRALADAGADVLRLDASRKITSLTAEVSMLITTRSWPRDSR
jgi:adenylate kinase